MAILTGCTYSNGGPGLCIRQWHLVIGDSHQWRKDASISQGTVQGDRDHNVLGISHILRRGGCCCTSCNVQKVHLLKMHTDLRPIWKYILGNLPFNYLIHQNIWNLQFKYFIFCTRCVCSCRKHVIHHEKSATQSPFLRVCAYNTYQHSVFGCYT